MNCSDFLYYFSVVNVGYFKDDNVNNYYDMEDTTSGTLYSFNFTLNQSADTWMGVQFYNERMYPEGCKDDSQVTSGLMRIYSEDSTLVYTYIYAWNGMN